MFQVFCTEDKGSCFSLKKAVKIIGMVIAGLVFAVVMALVFSLLVKGLWNWLMPSIFGLGLITFWQAFGLIVLAKLFFGGFGHKGPPSKWKNYPPESPFKGHDKEHHYHEFWESEGKAAFEKYVGNLKSNDEKEDN
ncbi:MAG: hypothetical protein KAR07_01320 [Spirochaetes bacterium]|nr:hypothetical protein [Spirochaetota bacterium]